MTANKVRRDLLLSVVSQLASGSAISEKASSPSKESRALNAPSMLMNNPAVKILNSLKHLFDLVEDISVQAVTQDLAFNMNVMTTLESITKCSARVIDATISDSQMFSSAATKVRQISASNAKKMSNLAYKFLQQDWCPPHKLLLKAG